MPDPEDIVEVERLVVTGNNHDYIAERTGWSKRAVAEQYIIHKMHDKQLIIEIKGKD